MWNQEEDKPVNRVETFIVGIVAGLQRGTEDDNTKPTMKTEETDSNFGSNTPVTSSNFEVSSEPQNLRPLSDIYASTYVVELE